MEVKCLHGYILFRMEMAVYIFKDKEVAGDGSYYGTSIREFCEGYQVDPQKLMDTAEAHKKNSYKNAS